MKESQFGFHYSWQDLKPIRPLVYTVLIIQIIGGVIGYFLLPKEIFFDRIWYGGAVLTFPGYIVGYLIQRYVYSKNISENFKMITRLGLISGLLTAIAVFMMWNKEIIA